MNFRNFFNREFSVVASAAVVIGFFSFVAKILGLLRNRILAGEFGAGDALDAYFAAFRVPDFIYNILIIGILSSVFIPVFAEYLAKDKESARKLLNVVLTVFAVLLVAFSVLAIIFMPTLMSFVAYGFDAEKMRLTVALSRIMFLSPILLGISNILSNVLQVHKMFFSFALAPVLYNIGIIVGALFLARPFGVAGLALGVVLGAFFHFLIQLPPLARLGFKFRLVFDWAHPGLKKIVWLSLPRTVGLAAYQINFIVITAIASAISSGSVSVFNFANDLQYVPIGIVALSFISAVFPSLSARYARNDISGFLNEFYLTVNQILYLVIPLSVFLILERAQIVRVVLGYGQFSWEDTRLTAAALGAFALSIFAQSLTPLFSRAFYAIQDTKTPILINVVSAALNIFFSFYFLSLLKAGGAFADFVAAVFKISDLNDIAVIALPLAFSASGIINFLWLYFAFSNRINDFDSGKILYSLLRINAASALMAIAVYPALYLTAMIVDTHTFFGIFAQGAAAFLVGTAVYVSASFIFKIPEFFVFWNLFTLPVKRIFLSRLFPIQVNGSEKL